MIRYTDFKIRDIETTINVSNSDIYLDFRYIDVKIQ